MATRTTFCESLRAEAQTTWDAVLDHRFFREVEADTLADEVFARYLRIEYGFIDTAAIALGYAVAKAPSFRERRHLAFNLYGLTTDQQQFFAAAFERIGVPADQRTGLPPQGASAALHDLFLGVARTEGYEEILACTLAAEWLYLTWCSRAYRTASVRPAIREWVALHAGGAFEEGVDWARAELEARGPRLGAERRARVGKLFEGVLAAEIPFHTAAYG
ncbi:MAG: TenA family protein [Roseiarcus sp.]|jgi:thiaminase/transcriptional activator TenA